MTASIDIRGVGKTHASARGPVTALAGVDIDVHEGEFLALLGPSGCGKSTLLRCIAGLDQASEGAIRVRGSVVDRPPDRLGMVFQRDVLLDWRNIGDNVLLAAEFLGLPRRDFTARARLALRAGDPADGRAVRCARCDDARRSQPGALAHPAGRQAHDHLRHAFDRRGGLSRRSRRRHVGAIRTLFSRLGIVKE